MGTGELCRYSIPSNKQEEGRAGEPGSVRRGGARVVITLPSGPTTPVLITMVVVSVPSSVVGSLHSYCSVQHWPSLAGNGLQNSYPVGGRHSRSVQITSPKLQ